VTAPSDGVVTHVLVEAGHQVDTGTPLVVMEPVVVEGMSA
jgi:urea carboxylase